MAIFGIDSPNRRGFQRIQFGVSPSRGQVRCGLERTMAQACSVRENFNFEEKQKG